MIQTYIISATSPPSGPRASRAWAHEKPASGGWCRAHSRHDQALAPSQQELSASSAVVGEHHPHHCTAITKSRWSQPVSPVSQADGHDKPRPISELVPRFAAVVEDVAVRGEDPVGDPVLAHVL